MSKTYITISTYNESENIKPLITRIFEVFPQAHVVVIDDNSPDGTWKIVKEMAEKDVRVHLIHRTAERGRGSAGIAGFIYALKEGADYVIEMDADFSHDPIYIPAFVNCMRDFDLVLGSRFVQGGRDAARGPIRRFVTFLANLYIRAFLQIKLHDCSSCFRCFRREVLESVELEHLISDGPSILQELLFKACGMEYRIIEITIDFVDRKLGKTKLTYRHLIKGFIMVLRLRFDIFPKVKKKCPPQSQTQQETIPSGR